MKPDLRKYKSEYIRNSDGRRFLGRQVVPGQCRLWDTVEEKFIDMGKNAVASKFTGAKKNKSLAHAIDTDVIGARVRDLKIVHKPLSDSEEWYEPES